MAQALISYLLNLALIDEFYLVKYSEYSWRKLDVYEEKIFRIRKLKALFYPSIEKIQENLPYWLKDFHGWTDIRPEKTATIMKEQFLINDLKKEVEKVVLKKENFQSRRYIDIQEFRKEIRGQLEECRSQCPIGGDDGCRHTYKIEEIKERIEQYYSILEDYDLSISEKRWHYQRALGVQKLGEEGYREYERCCEDDY